ncbi:MAG TPA: ferritin-like domain-containing protein [Terriglobales bacterium]|nr:ferritin-like domain-containing protein [Terriglobales bacterium]
MKANSLRELYVEQLRDLYDAEHQIIKALPKMIGEVSSEQLRNALSEHLEITRQQAQRLERIFENMGQKSKSEKCKGMEGLIKEGNDVVKTAEDEDMRDAAIISAAQRVEHYEMAGYGTVRTYAELLGEQEAAQLLQQTLDEEKEADQELTNLAEQINVEAGEGEVRAVARTKGTISKGRRVA